jgi:hypothetical protein
MTQLARKQLSAAAWGVTCVFSVLLLISAMAAAAHKATSANTDGYTSAPLSISAEQ